MKNLLTFIFWIPAIAGTIMLFSCGNDSTTGTNNNTINEVLIDTNVSYTVLPGTGGADIWLFLNPSNNIKVEYKYSIQPHTIITAEMYLILNDSLNIWPLDTVKTFTVQQQTKNFTYNPNNSNSKKIRLNIHYDNTSLDTVFLKFDNFKVSKLN